MTEQRSENFILNQTLEALEDWAAEEIAENPESGVSVQERYFEIAQSYIDNLQDEIKKRAASLSQPVTPLEALQNYRRDLHYQFSLGENNFELINAHSCGTPCFENALQCVEYIKSLDQAIEQLGGKVD